MQPNAAGSETEPKAVPASSRARAEVSAKCAALLRIRSSGVQHRSTATLPRLVAVVIVHLCVTPRTRGPSLPLRQVRDEEVSREVAAPSCSNRDAKQSRSERLGAAGDVRTRLTDAAGTSLQAGGRGFESLCSHLDRTVNTASCACTSQPPRAVSCRRRCRRPFLCGGGEGRIGEAGRVEHRPV